MLSLCFFVVVLCCVCLFVLQSQSAVARMLQMSELSLRPFSEKPPQQQYPLASLPNILYLLQTIIDVLFRQPLKLQSVSSGLSVTDSCTGGNPMASSTGINLHPTKKKCTASQTTMCMLSDCQFISYPILIYTYIFPAYHPTNAFRSCDLQCA